MLRGPLVPRFAFAVLFHERAEKCIIIEPGGFLRAKILKCGLIASPTGSPTLTGRSVHVARLPPAPLSIFGRVFAEKFANAFSSNRRFNFLDPIILHPSSAKSRKIDIGEGGLKIFAR